MTPTFFLNFFSLLFLLNLSPSLQASNGGFSVELIRRDSPKSPFYDPNQTPYQRILNALERSVARTQQFIDPESKAIGYLGEFLMNISIGTPPFEIIAVADTGSDLTWTQCAPCARCYKQDRPLFQPRFSQTYTKLSCNALACQQLPVPICRKQKCRYIYDYVDQTVTKGILASETITMSTTNGVPVSIPNIAFGCSHYANSTTPLLTSQTSGIVGLGGGPLSLVSQMGNLINWKFSHCLVPYYFNVSSTLYFGPDSVPNGPGVKSTPLYSFRNFRTSYLLSLKGFTVGNAYIRMIYPQNNTRGPNIIIDSGTTFTFLPEVVVEQLSAVVDRHVNATRVVSQSPFNLCYRSDSFRESAPTIVAHFAGGADVELGPINTFVFVSNTTTCFNFIGVDPQKRYPFFGNYAQMNYVVAYDLIARTVSFKKADCTKFL